MVAAKPRRGSWTARMKEGTTTTVLARSPSPPPSPLSTGARVSALHLIEPRVQLQVPAVDHLAEKAGHVAGRPDQHRAVDLGQPHDVARLDLAGRRVQAGDL